MNKQGDQFLAVDQGIAKLGGKSRNQLHELLNPPSRARQSRKRLIQFPCSHPNRSYASLQIQTAGGYGLSFVGASFLSGCLIFRSSVQGGAMPIKRACATDCPKCSAAWRTMKSKMPRCVFFPPNQSMLFSRSVSGTAMIAMRAWANESFSVAITFALSVVDFSRFFTSSLVGGGVPTSL